MLYARKISRGREEEVKTFARKQSLLATDVARHRHIIIMSSHSVSKKRYIFHFIVGLKCKDDLH